jgi:hypothetical protein
MSLTKATYSMITGAPANVLDTGASSNGVQNNTTAVQATLDQVDNVPGATAVSENNVRISIAPNFSYANVIPFEDLTWPYGADVWYQGSTYETVLMKNQFSNSYQALPVITTAWVGSTAYYAGDKIVNGSQAYECTISGTSASSGGPTGTGSAITDGTVTWRSINNGYYGPVPVNELRVHAPYHPGLVLNSLTSASYDGVTQPAQQIGQDLYDAGGTDTSQYKSIVFATDNVDDWYIQVDGLTGEMNFNKKNQLWRLFFDGTYGNMGLQKRGADYPIDCAGAMRVMTDQTVDTPVRADNKLRYPGAPAIYLEYIKTGSDFKGNIRLEGSTGYQIAMNAPVVAGTSTTAYITAANAAGTAYGVGLESSVPSFEPSPDNAISLGRAGARWTTVYATTGTINTSDERLKQQIKPIDDAALRAWAKVEYVQYKWNDAVEKKGDGARWHFGLIAQKVKEAFESEGLDAFEYGVLCYDTWEARAEEIDDNGVVVKRAQEAGNRYGVRYEEALALECAYLRSKLK